VANKKVGKSVDAFKLLNRWNFALAGLHFIQGVLILVLSTTRTFPVTVNYLTADPLQTKAAGHTVLALATRHIFDINLAYLVAATFFLSAIAHIVSATVYRPVYEQNLDHGMNKLRWVEYSLSASLMMLSIGLLVGVGDFATLLTLFGLTAIMNLLGLAMEVYNRGKQSANWLAYWIGVLAGVVPWVVIAIYLVAGGIYGNRAPGFVYGIFASLLILFSSFAVNMYLQYRRVGKWKNYLYGERVYMLLSLIAKTALAWQIFAGTLRP
jgi:hypothetical protein